MTALRGLAVKLGSLREGRKAILFVSEGFSSSTAAAARPERPVPWESATRRRATRRPASSTAEERARFRFGCRVVQRPAGGLRHRQPPQHRDLPDRPARAGDQRVSNINENVGLRADQEFLRATQDTLVVLAINTDGRAIINRNDLEKGLRQIVRDTSAYYLLATIRRPPPMASSTRSRYASSVRARRCVPERATGRRQPTKPPRRAHRRSRRRRRPSEKALSTVETRQRDAFVSTWLGTARADDGPHAGHVRVGADPPIPGRSVKTRRASRCWRAGEAVPSTSGVRCRPKAPRRRPIRPQRRRSPPCGRARRSASWCPPAACSCA